jgi:hypothetical protein
MNETHIDIIPCACGEREDYYICSDSSLPKIIRCNGCGKQTAALTIPEMVKKWNEIADIKMDRNYDKRDAYNISKVDISSQRVRNVLGF